jgi:hypothetical protein
MSDRVKARITRRLDDAERAIAAARAAVEQNDADKFFSARADLEIAALLMSSISTPGIEQALRS